MKIVFFLVLIALGARGQTNAPVSGSASRGLSEITAASADFDLSASNRQAVYRGHVYVNDPEVQLWCELLTVKLPADGGHVSHVQAETNVVIDFTDHNKQTNHLTAAKAVYTYKVENAVTNEIVTFTGNPVVETPDAVISAEPIQWDRATARLHFTNPHMKSRQNSNGGGTNASPLKLF